MRRRALVPLSLCVLALLFSASAAHGQTLVTSISLGNIGAQGPPVFDQANGNVYVTASGTVNDGSVSIISGSTNTIAATLYFGGTSQSLPGVLATSNGDVYVPDVGDTIHVISGTSNTIIQNITVGNGPEVPTYDPSNGMVYVSSVLGPISVIDTSNNSVVANIQASASGTGGGPALYDSVNGDLYTSVYTTAADVTADAIAVISGSTNTVIDTIPISSSGVDGLAIDTSTGSVLATTGDGRFVVVSSSNQVVANVTGTGASPVFDGSNSDFYLTTLTSSVLVFSSTSDSVVGNVTLGGNPTGIAIDSSSGDALVTWCLPGGTQGSPTACSADVISGTTDLGGVTVGNGPSAAVFDSSNGYFYVPNNDGTVSVVNPAVVAESTTATSSAPSSSSTSSGLALSSSYLFVVGAIASVLALALAVKVLVTKRGPRRFSLRSFSES